MANKMIFVLTNIVMVMLSIVNIIMYDKYYAIKLLFPDVLIIDYLGAQPKRLAIILKPISFSLIKASIII